MKKFIVGFLSLLMLFIMSPQILAVEASKITILDRNLKEVSMTEINSQSAVPVEVRELVSKYKNDKNITSVKITTSKARTYNLGPSLRSTNGPYEGYKHHTYKDWLITYTYSSLPAVIRSGAWGNYHSDRIRTVVHAGIGLLAGGLSKVGGITFSVFDLLSSVLPHSVSNSTKITFRAELHAIRTDKLTYVMLDTGNWQLGLKSQFMQYRFQNSINYPGYYTKKAGFTEYQYTNTENYFYPDKMAWNAHNDPWTEMIGTIEYGGVYFNSQDGPER